MVDFFFILACVLFFDAGFVAGLIFSCRGESSHVSIDEKMESEVAK